MLILLLLDNTKTCIILSTPTFIFAKQANMEIQTAAPPLPPHYP